MSIVWTRLLRFAQFGFQFATAMTTAAPAIDTLLFVQCCSQKRDLFVVHVANLFWRQLSILTVLNDYFVASLLCANHQSKEANIHFRHWHSLCPNSVEIAVCFVITSFGNQIWIWLIDVSIRQKWTKRHNQMEQVSKIMAERRHDLVLLMMWKVQAFWWKRLNFVFN